MAADEEKGTDRHNTNTLSGSATDEAFDYYGVWVKSGPEDVSDSEEDDSDGIFDLEITDDDDTTSSESIGIPDADDSDEDAGELARLSEEEEALLADLESSDSDIDTPSVDETGSAPSEPEPSGDELEFRFAEGEEELPDLELDDSDDLSLDEDEVPGTHGFPSQEAGEHDTSEVPESQRPSASESERGPVREIELEAADSAADFDDVSAVAGEMSEPTSADRGSGGYSKEAFDRIQGELTDIKSELAALRSELAVLRGNRASGSEPQSQSAAATTHSPAGELPVEDSEPVFDGSENRDEGLVFEPEGSEEAAPGQTEEDTIGEESEGGFFEEEDDETIALTGDELDNILNTAEFTEEVGKPTDFDDGDLDLDLSTLESNDYSFSDDAIETPEDEPQYADTEPVAEDEAFVFEDQSVEGDIPPEVDQDDSSAIGGETSEAQGAEEDIFGASDDEVDVLANMDIDSELADIDALDDEEPPIGPETAEHDMSLDDVQAAADESPTEERDTGESAASVRPSEPEEMSGDSTPPEADQIDNRTGGGAEELPENLKEEIKSVLSYMDQLLESLPEEKIREFAHSEHFEVYKRLFEELGLEP